MNTAKQLFNIFALIVIFVSVLAPFAKADSLGLTAIWISNNSNTLSVKQGESPAIQIFATSTLDFQFWIHILDNNGKLIYKNYIHDDVASNINSLYNPVYKIDTSNLLEGSYQIQVNVQNPTDITSLKTITLNLNVNANVIPPINHAPVIQSIPDQIVEKTKTVSFYVTATDQDNDPLTFAAENIPAEALFEKVAENKYEFSWIPDNTVAVGAYPVKFTVTDNKSPAVSTVANINIIEKTQPIPTNTPPVLSLPQQYPTTVKEGETLTFKLNAKDADSIDATGSKGVTFTAQKYCSWTDVTCQMDAVLNNINLFLGGGYYQHTIDANTGVFTFTPKYTFVKHSLTQKNIEFKFSAYDGKDYSSPQYATFTVTDVNRAPIITSTPVTTATVNQQYSYTVTTTDPDVEDIPTVTSSLTNGPQGMAINNNIVTWTPTAVGKYHVTVIANDNVVSGPKDSVPQSFTIIVSAEPPKDTDGDGIPDNKDNCPTTFNPDQKDSNNNGIGDACEAPVDTDGDGIPDNKDNCPTVFNPDQKDSNNNGIGDACEAPVDTDGDGIPDNKDNCPTTFNPDQKDSNNNGIGDACENTPVNNWPMLNQIGDKTVKFGETLQFAVQATDADNDTLTYSTFSDTLKNYNFNNQVFTFTPTLDQVNKSYNVFFIVNDTKISTFEEIKITVLPADNNTTNHKPVISSTPITSATVDELYTYPVKVTDDGPFTCVLKVAPQGMSISKDCVITWTPTHEGQEPVTIVVSDGEYTVTQSYVITVSNYQNAKIMSLNIPDETVALGDSFKIGVNMKNDGKKDINDAQVSVIIYDLGIKASTSTFDFEKGTFETKNLVVQIPSDVEPGEYLVKVTLSNVYYHEAAYRLVTITGTQN